MKNNTMLIVLGLVLIAGVGIFAFQNMNANQTSSSQVMEEAETQPTAAEEAGSTESASTDENMSKTIVDIAVENGNFKTLTTALTEAGLVETLSGEGPFTVFAPTDEAFAKLPAGTVESLLKDKEKLTSILTYHVVPGKVMAADVVKLTSATTVQGQDVTVKVEGGKVMINDAQVVTTDIEASNGVIHVIDTVILPKE